MVVSLNQTFSIFSYSVHAFHTNVQARNCIDFIQGSPSRQNPGNVKEFEYISLAMLSNRNPDKPKKWNEAFSQKLNGK